MWSDPEDIPDGRWKVNSRGNHKPHLLIFPLANSCLYELLQKRSSLGLATSSSPASLLPTASSHHAGAGWLFGEAVTTEFLHINGLDLIARAHQLVQEGYQYRFNSQLVTVWSAPNYCYRCGNLASIMALDSQHTVDWIVFEAVAASSTNVPPRTPVPYFL